MEQTYLDLLRDMKRNKLFELYRLLLSPRYEAPWWYWEDFFKCVRN